MGVDWNDQLVGRQIPQSKVWVAGLRRYANHPPQEHIPALAARAIRGSGQSMTKSSRQLSVALDTGNADGCIPNAADEVIKCWAEIWVLRCVCFNHQGL